MKRYERILLGIGNPDRDQRMVDYAVAITRLAESRELHLLHVRPTVGPITAQADSGSHGDITSESLQRLTHGHLEGNTIENLRCEVLSGSPAIEILRYAHDHDIDLMVIGGGGPDPEHEANLARRITRKSTCSVLVLPENSEPKISNILVPVRNSECSANAVSAACAIAQSTGAGIVCVNVFQVHSGLSRGGKSLEDFTEDLHGIAEKECEDLLRGIDAGGVEISTICLPDLYSKAVPIILEAVFNESADLIVIGARGRTGAAGILLSDVTEKLIRQSPVPLLADKKKGETVGLLKALLTIAGQD